MTAQSDKDIAYMIVGDVFIYSIKGNKNHISLFGFVGAYSMGKGIIYVMSTVVSGLIKIGKTGSDNFDQRMKYLEDNGYQNVTGLKRRYAIEVDDYDEKEVLLVGIR